MKRSPLFSAKHIVRRGFTLTEAAIVLGVIGAIAAAIFVAAGSSQYRNKLNQTADELNIITANMRALYSSQKTAGLPSQAFSPAFDQTLIQQNVFPSEMVSGTVANNPWDQTVANGSAEIGILAGTPTQFIVRFVNIPAEACTDLLMHNSQPGSDTGLQQIVVGATTYTAAANQLPVSALNAAAACPAGLLYTIDWYYALGS